MIGVGGLVALVGHWVKHRRLGCSAFALTAAAGHAAAVAAAEAGPEDEDEGQDADDDAGYGWPSGVKLGALLAAVRLGTGRV